MWTLRRAGHSGARPTSAPVGLTLGAGFVTVVAACFAAGIAFAPQHATGRLAVLALAVGAFAAAAGDARAAMVTAVIGWLFLNGFLVGREGELHWHGRADLLRLAVLLGAALAGTVHAWLRRMARAYVRLHLIGPGLGWPEDPAAVDRTSRLPAVRYCPRGGTPLVTARRGHTSGRPRARNGRAGRGGPVSEYRTRESKGDQR